MPKPSRKPHPKDIAELCHLLTPYFDQLTAWLEARQAEIILLKQHAGIPLAPRSPDDPPPKPPDLGE